MKMSGYLPRWLWLCLLTILLWGGWAYLGRVVGSTLKGEETLILSTLGLIPIVVWLAIRVPRAERFHGRCVTWAVLAGVFGNAGNLAYYQLMNAGAKASTAVPLTAMYPVVTILLALMVLKERLNLLQWAGVICSLAAIHAFNGVQQDFGLSRWLVFALVALALYGVAALFQKLSTRHLSAEASTLWFLLGLMPLALWCGFNPGLRTGIGMRDMGLAVLSGLLLGLGNLTLLGAYSRDGKASIITPLSSTYPVVTVALAVAFLGEQIQPVERRGIILSLVSVVLLSLEKRASSPSDPPA